MSWQLFDRLRVLFKQANIYNYENLHQNQADVARLTAGGKALNLATYGVLLEQTNLQINRLERFKDYDQMSEMGEISFALDAYADESTLIESEYKHNLLIRSKHKRVKNELSDLFYSTLCTDNMLRSYVRYLCKYGDLPMEIVPTKNRDGVAALRHMNVYNFSRIETKKGDLIGFFYQDEGDQKPNFLHPWQVVHFRIDSLENIFKPYGACEKFGSRVYTPNGYKNIEDFKKGDEVYSFDGQKLVRTRVVAACHSGVKEILRIRTQHFQNECSENHPFLTRSWELRDFKFGKKWYSSLKYKRADELAIDDELVIPKAIEQNEKIQLPCVGTLRKQGGEISNKGVDFGSRSGIKRLSLPRVVDEKFARLFGFMIGDGWLLRQLGQKPVITGVAFALGEYEDLNARYEKTLSDYGMSPGRRQKPKQGKLPFAHCVAYSHDFGCLLSQMGFCNGATRKRLPEWIYRCSKSIQKAFIEGLIDADGSSFVDEWKCERYQIELANLDLVKDVKLLIHHLGWKCGQIIKRKRSKDNIILGRVCKRSPSWLIYFFKSQLFKLPKTNFGGFGGARRREFQQYGENIRFEGIVSIDHVGKFPTADIQVEHEASNFVADGMVIHNSLMEGARKDFKRLRLMEDAALIYRIVRSPERRVFKIPVGEIPAQHVPTYMEMFARNIKKKRFYNPNTGQIDERWSPLIQEDDYYLPRRPDGSGPEVDTLPGGENLDQIADIEYFKKKMISALKIPFSRVGLGEAGEDSRQSLSQVAPEFAKAVQFIQRIVACGLQKVALVHLGLKGFSVNEMKSTELYLPASSAIDELYRIEKWATRADVIANLKDTALFSPEWILKTFTDMSSDEIAAMQKEVASLPQEPGLGEPPLPTESVEAPLKVEEDRLLAEYSDFQKRTKAVNEEVKIEHNMLQNLLTTNELDGLNNGKKTLVEHRIDVKSELFESTYKEGEASFLFEQATFKKKQAQIEKERRELLGPYVENPEITDKDIPA